MAADALAKRSAPQALADAAPDNGTQLAVQLGSRSALLRHRQAQPLLERLQSLLPQLTQAPAQAPGVPADLQVTLRASGQAASTFSLWGNSLRWQSPGQALRQGSLSAEQAQELVRLATQALDAAQAAKL